MLKIGPTVNSAVNRLNNLKNTSVTLPHGIKKNYGDISLGDISKLLDNYGVHSTRTEVSRIGNFTNALNVEEVPYRILRLKTDEPTVTIMEENKEFSKHISNGIASIKEMFNSLKDRHSESIWLKNIDGSSIYVDTYKKLNGEIVQISETVDDVKGVSKVYGLRKEKNGNITTYTTGFPEKDSSDRWFEVEQDASGKIVRLQEGIKYDSNKFVLTE